MCIINLKLNYNSMKKIGAWFDDKGSKSRKRKVYIIWWR